MKRALAACLLAACGGSSTTPPVELPTWDKTLPEASVMGVRRGLTPARGIVHLHSPYSHDACDNMPRDGSGVPNEPCLADLRAALCTDHIDFAALTDHDDTMADEEFTTLFSMRGSDTPVMKDGEQIASQIHCDDGHVVTVTIGGENDLMPIMLEHHVPGTVIERHGTYNANDATAATAFRVAGGLTWVAHIESKTVDGLRATADGIEVYNLHANLDPKIRPLLGLPAGDAIAAAAEFADTNPGHPEPDLALLSFLAPSQPAITAWHALLGEGKHLPVTAGSDAHENALPIMLADGERGDSYRRVMRWFGNIALVSNPQDPIEIKNAVRSGKMFAVFELFGTPEGFDAHADNGVELGDTAIIGSTLEVDVPHVRNLDPSLPVPVIRARVFLIAPGGAVSTVGDVTDEAHLTVPLTAPGAYRVEISITPRHLGPYLGDLGPAAAEVELPWIYASPIYVQ